jgi:hypothetical protein
MPSSGMLRRVTLVISDVSEECIASIIRVTKIAELGTLAVTSIVRTDLSEERIAFISKGKGIRELDTTIAISSYC